MDPSPRVEPRLGGRLGGIFDYILTKKDGSQEGNETGPLIEARERAGATVQKK